MKNASPLSIEDIYLIDKTNLPIRERHHLRLLAHCLACFKQMKEGSASTALPERNDFLNWCFQQPGLNEDKEFIPMLLTQFEVAAGELQDISESIHIEPLNLTLENLIDVAMKPE